MSGTTEKGGRPLKVPTPERFKELADAYFAECEGKERRPKINGLCLALGLYDPQALDDYETYGGFSLVVKEARCRLRDAWEDGLAQSNVAGAIFWLKQQGWKDTQDVKSTNETTLKGEIAVRPTMTREEWTSLVASAAGSAKPGA